MLDDVQGFHRHVAKRFQNRMETTQQPPEQYGISSDSHRNCSSPSFYLRLRSSR